MARLLPLPTSVQEAGDPVPFGPAHWEPTQWIGLAVYVALFLLFVLLVYLLARPYRDSEVSAGDEEAGEGPGGLKAPPSERRRS